MASNLLVDDVGSFSMSSKRNFVEEMLVNKASSTIHILDGKSISVTIVFSHPIFIEGELPQSSIVVGSMDLNRSLSLVCVGAPTHSSGLSHDGSHPSTKHASLLAPSTIVSCIMERQVKLRNSCTWVEC